MCSSTDPVFRVSDYLNGRLFVVALDTFGQEIARGPLVFSGYGATVEMYATRIGRLDETMWVTDDDGFDTPVKCTLNTTIVGKGTRIYLNFRGQ